MSFLFDIVLIPFWFIFFILASAAPLWIKWGIKFHKKFIVTGLLKKIFRRTKTVAERKIDILKKATEHWDANDHLSEITDNKAVKRKSAKKKIDPDKKQNILLVLKVLANAGDAGILPKSISDKVGINSIETNNALNYLIEKTYVEDINTTSGNKYYLTALGRKYCINKKYI
ncbi:MAG TPA: hypothetical protein ENJ28_09920 [Gammaproteobacteria bacterium]|nr:hypothetical protein [Gammaproteobacteria bacterium]